MGSQACSTEGSPKPRKRFRICKDEVGKSPSYNDQVVSSSSLHMVFGQDQCFVTSLPSFSKLLKSLGATRKFL